MHGELSLERGLSKKDETHGFVPPFWGTLQITILVLCTICFSKSNLSLWVLDRIVDSSPICPVLPTYLPTYLHIYTYLPREEEEGFATDLWPLALHRLVAVTQRSDEERERRAPLGVARVSAAFFSIGSPRGAIYRRLTL